MDPSNQPIDPMASTPVEASSGSIPAPFSTPDSSPDSSPDPAAAFAVQLDDAPRHSRLRRGSAALAVLAVVVLVAALVAVATGHGSASPSDGVASLHNSSAHPSAAASAVDPQQAALAFSQCMRSHGIPDFPDPVTQAGGGVGLQISGGQGGALDPNSTTFKSAMTACQSLMPGGGPQTAGGQIDPQNQAQLLAYSKCMRDHGVANFPDPVFQGASVSLNVPDGVDPNSPTFQAAQKACQSLMAMPGASGAPNLQSGNGGVVTGGQP